MLYEKSKINYNINKPEKILKSSILKIKINGCFGSRTVLVPNNLHAFALCNCVTSSVIIIILLVTPKKCPSATSPSKPTITTPFLTVARIVKTTDHQTLKKIRIKVLFNIVNWNQSCCLLLCLSSLICQSFTSLIFVCPRSFSLRFSQWPNGDWKHYPFFLFLLFLMTYYEDDEVVPELTLRIDIDENNNNNNKGDYLKLKEYEEGEPGSPRRRSCGKVWYWVKLAFFLTSVGLLAAVFIKWVGPFFMDKVSLFIIFSKLYVCMWLCMYLGFFAC